MVTGLSTSAFRVCSAWLVGLVARARPLAIGAVLVSVGCGDPVHDQLVTSLGAEDPSVAPGPTHRPGQPCLACHGDLGPAKLAFTIGGTAYAVQGKPLPLVGGIVQVGGQDGHSVNLTTNVAGNFFVTSSDFVPTYPTRNFVWSADAKQQAVMFSLANREGSCATCHSNPPGPNSPGPVWLFATAAAAQSAGSP